MPLYNDKIGNDFTSALNYKQILLLQKVKKYKNSHGQSNHVLVVNLGKFHLLANRVLSYSYEY